MSESQVVSSDPGAPQSNYLKFRIQKLFCLISAKLKQFDKVGVSRWWIVGGIAIVGLIMMAGIFLNEHSSGNSILKAFEHGLPGLAISLTGCITGYFTMTLLWERRSRRLDYCYALDCLRMIQCWFVEDPNNPGISIAVDKVEALIAK